MPKYIVKVERHGGQVRLTLPKNMVDKLNFQRVAYAICHVSDGEAIIITPFIDARMLDNGVSEDKDREDKGA